jgi:effector-binding domain-containing protein
MTSALGPSTQSPATRGAADLVMTEHSGPPADIDLAYADLGSYLVEKHLRVGNQIREHYLVDESDTHGQAAWQTEIAWPILIS